MAICSPRYARAANGPCRAENNLPWAVNNHNAQQKHIIVILHFKSITTGERENLNFICSHPYVIINVHIIMQSIVKNHNVIN